MDLPKQPVSTISLIQRPRRQQLQRSLEIAAANGGEGWIYHQDLAKQGRANGITIAANVRTQITIDGLGAGSTEELDTIPRPTTGLPLLSNGKFYPVELNDNYLIRFGFMAAITDPGLTSTEDDNGLRIEYDVGGIFDTHDAFTNFIPDPGPMRRDRNNWNAISGVSLLSALIAPRMTVLTDLLSDAVAEHNTSGQKFTEFGQAFAGSPVVANGVGFFVTPTTDVILWDPDLTITRLSSPTT